MLCCNLSYMKPVIPPLRYQNPILSSMADRLKKKNRKV